MLHGRFVHVGKTLTDLQILGCGLHQNAFGGRAPPGPARGAYSAPPDPLVGSSGHLVYYIHALALQSAGKNGFKNATNVGLLGVTLPGPTG